MSTLKALIFDFDGVIVNSYETNYQCQKKRFVGITREDHKRFFEGNVHEIREDLVARGKIVEDTTIDHHLIMRDYFLNKQQMDKNILRTLEKLHSVYSLFIVTSFVEKYVNEFLDKHEMSYLFEGVYGIETHKKKVVKFNLIYDSYNLVSSDCLFVTDTLGDVIEANKVKMNTVALDSGFHERERLKRGNPYKIISRFDELISIDLLN